MLEKLAEGNWRLNSAGRSLITFGLGQHQRFFVKTSPKYKTLPRFTLADVFLNSRGKICD